MIDITELAATIGAIPSSIGNTALVCIDGRAGSGKTTCALALQDLLPQSHVIHMDSLYAGWDDDLDSSLAQRVVEQIVSPIAAGKPAKYQQFNWILGDFDGWVEVPVPRILILEGVASAHPDIRQHAALSVWIEIDSSLGAQRVIARDGEISQGHIIQWQTQEDVYIHKYQTPLNCDLTFSGV